MTDNRSGGGAIAGRNCTIKINKSTFTHNRVHGFAGGAIYFITADWDPITEAVGEVRFTMGFNKIFKNIYKKDDAVLTVIRSTFENNDTRGVTCFKKYGGTCRKSELQSRGAGGALYVLKSKKFNIKLDVTLNNNSFRHNRGAHITKSNKSEIVIVGNIILKLIDNSITKHPDNLYHYSLTGINPPTYNKSNDYLNTKKSGLLFEQSPNRSPAKATP
ncbi:hypothetical protein MNBD_GAMMA12-2601 [hydrothermal vent metagenome]|uniref:Right handed beta helix domain-containing protein n=1 Tax=hydrothermal vent metagenome TaxID=652676 RepID=A0A3B0Z856_9ZZZZ